MFLYILYLFTLYILYKIYILVISPHVVGPLRALFLDQG